jgi:flagellar motor switch protein FliM
VATLDPEELDTLMQAIEDGQIGSSGSSSDRAIGSVTPHDLTNPARNVPDPMPGLEAINEKIGRFFASALSGRTRSQIQVKSGPGSRITCEDLMPIMAPPVVLGVMEMGAGQATGVVIVDSNLADGLLLAGLGAQSVDPERAPAEGREMTNLEFAILRRLLSHIAEATTRAFLPLMPLRAQLVRIEADPRMALTSDPREIAILSKFDIDGDMKGQLQVALPFSLLEPIRDKLSQPILPSDSRMNQEQFSADLRRSIFEVEVDLSAELGAFELTVEEFLALEVGQIMNLHSDENTPLDVKVSGRPKLKGIPAVRSGGMVVELVDEDEDNQNALHPQAPNGHYNSSSQQNPPQTPTEQNR